MGIKEIATTIALTGAAVAAGAGLDHLSGSERETWVYLAAWLGGAAAYMVFSRINGKSS